MKKVLKILIILLIIGLIGGIVYYVFREITPIDDTKKLYISCNNYNESYDILSGDKIEFAQNDEKCKLSLEVRNIERTFLKLKSNNYFYMSTSDNKVNDNGLFNEIYIESNKDLLIFSKDKDTKFHFQYK